ncbi:MAG TPA: hypothetical protein VM869_02225 [Enhygromyxa sp.]|nr:hypothetical protein [Enhygromyxa sp.]
MMLAIFELLTLLAAAPEIGEDCGERVCIYGTDDGVWTPAAQLSKKQRASEKKKNRKHADVALRVVVEGGRGSVFVDGRYLASEGPHAERTLDPGKHEIEVRDGTTVVALGVLTIPRKIEALTLVIHADR